MKTLLLALSIWLYTLSAQAAVTIVGPEKAEVGEVVRLVVDANFELSDDATLGDIFAAIKEVRVMYEDTQLPVSVRLLFIGNKISLVLESEAKIKEAGRNFFWVVYWPTKETGTFVVKAGPELPPDPPNPPDPPDPQPGGKYQVAIFYEKGDLPKMPKAQLLLLRSQPFRQALAQAGHVLLGIVDDDIQSHSSGTILSPFADAVKGNPLPRIAIAPLNVKGEVKDFPLPDTQEGVLELLRKGGE